VRRRYNHQTATDEDERLVLKDTLHILLAMQYAKSLNFAAHASQRGSELIEYLTTAKRLSRIIVYDYPGCATAYAQCDYSCPLPASVRDFSAPRRSPHADRTRMIIVARGKLEYSDSLCAGLTGIRDVRCSTAV